MLGIFKRVIESIYMFTKFDKKRYNSFKNPIFIFLGIILLLCLLLAYSNHFSNSFHFDDNHTIQNNTAIQKIDIKSFFTDAKTFSSLPANQTYRPLTTLENALDYKIANGLNEKIFHIHIFSVYILLCVLICVFVKMLLDFINFSKYNQFWGLLVASIYGLLCVNAETVNYIIQRAEITAALFILLGLVVFMSNGFWRKKYIYLVFPFIGFFAKEMALVFAPILLLFFLVFEENVYLLHFYKKDEFAKCIKSIFKALPALILTLLFYVFYKSMLPATFSLGGLSTFNYAITQPMVVCHYILTFFVPYNLSADTDWVAYTSILDYRAIVGIVIYLSLFYLALRASKKKKTRLFSFGMLWFFVTLLPTSSFIPLAEVMNDHRSFIPYIGLTMALVFGLNYLVQKYLIDLLGKKIIQNTVLLVFLLFLGSNIYGIRQRNKVWKSELSLWKDVTIKSPNNGRGLMNYGLALMAKGDYPNAEIYFEKAQVLNPNYNYVYINLGIVKSSMGNAIEAEDYFKKAIALNDKDHKSVFFYARFLHKNGRLEEAKILLEKALRISPNFSKATNLLMQVYHETGDWSSLKKITEEILAKSPDNILAKKYVNIARNKKTALWILEQEIRLDPSPKKYLDLSLKFFKINDYKNTLRAANEALKLKNDYPAAYNNIGIAHYKLGEFNKAIEAYNKALVLDPNYTLANNNLKNALKAKNKIKLSNSIDGNKLTTAKDYLNMSLNYYNKGNFKACIDAAEKSNKISPNSKAFNNICAAYNQLGKYDMAIIACEKAVALDAKNTLAKNNLQHAKNNL